VDGQRIDITGMSDQQKQLARELDRLGKEGAKDIAWMQKLDKAIEKVNRSLEVTKALESREPFERDLKELGRLDAEKWKVASRGMALATVMKEKLNQFRSTTAEGAAEVAAEKAEEDKLEQIRQGPQAVLPKEEVKPSATAMQDTAEELWKNYKLHPDQGLTTEQSRKIAQSFYDEAVRLKNTDPEKSREILSKVLSMPGSDSNSDLIDKVFVLHQKLCIQLYGDGENSESESVKEDSKERTTKKDDTKKSALDSGEEATEQEYPVDEATMKVIFHDWDTQRELGLSHVRRWKKDRADEHMSKLDGILVKNLTKKYKIAPGQLDHIKAYGVKHGWQ
jgi:hypothetical protein